MQNKDLKPIGSLLSENNNAYYVEVCRDEKHEDLLNSSLSAIQHTVDWQVIKGSNKFIKCDSDTVNNTHVMEYLLNDDGNLWYSYKLKVKVNKPGVYYFTDATNDKYKLSVELESFEHALSYNSKHPQIVLVEYIEY
ncbi:MULTISPECIES: hypothetical protein [Acinetobacter]|uniref:hypothetical protein n=1 Tax=Acinetobacter TaxID=469 RepID=UPI0002AEC1E0|nr:MULTISPECIES: hypothetical protein [Acinetobacter]ELW84540.1 hypothetical protein ACINWC743_A0826 [Acinetobacter sp. WC-743]MBJ8426606.1 hypothetical protein [Acinetobacter bereziniae]MBJ8476109.1 hypothetical protein [Acinetobacter bereziniae]